MGYTYNNYRFKINNIRNQASKEKEATDEPVGYECTSTIQSAETVVLKDVVERLDEVNATLDKMVELLESNNKSYKHLMILSELLANIDGCCDNDDWE